MSSQISHHDTRISITKAVCIILMVIGHSGCPEYLGKWIYLFHMPCFFFISGFLFNEKYLTNVRQGIKKRFIGLWWPFVKWSLIFLLLHSLFFQLQIYSYDYNWNEFGIKLFKIFTLTGSEQLLGGYWFLKELLYASIISLLMMKIWSMLLGRAGINKQNEGLILSCLFVALAMVHFKIPGINNKTMLATAYYLAGYSLSKSQYSRNSSLFIGIICLIATVIMPLFLSGSMDIQGMKIFPYFVISLVGTITVIIFSGIVQYTWMAKGLDYVGKNTLYILTFHFISFKLVSLVKIWQYDLPITALSSFPVIGEYNTFYWIPYSIMGIIVPLLLLEGTHRILNRINSKKNFI